MQLVKLLVSCVILITLAPVSSAQTAKRGTKEEAVAIAKKVKELWRTIGPEKSINAVNRLTHNLRNKDLYPWIGHIDKYIVAHYFHAVRGLRYPDDSNGPLGKIMPSMVKIAKTKKAGWQQYYWPNPVTKNVEIKESYILSLDNEYFVAVGVFRRPKKDEIPEYE